MNMTTIPNGEVPGRQAGPASPGRLSGLPYGSRVGVVDLDQGRKAQLW